MNAGRAKIELENFVRSRGEWLLIFGSTGKGFPLQNGEIEITLEREKLFCGFVGGKGFETWRIVDYQFLENEKISLDLTRNFGKENEKLSLVPRVSAFDLSREAEQARIEKARKIAGLIVESNPQAKLVRADLNRETGRFAQIVFEDSRRGSRRQIAAVADVSDSLAPEILISTAILWLEKLRARKKNPVENVWIMAEKKQAKDLSKLHALLRENRKNKIKIFEIFRAGGEAQSEEIKEIPALPVSGLWRRKPPKIEPLEYLESGATARKIIELAPDEIDAVFSKNGETLRFSGLPFARVRKISGEEKTWFGVEARRQILSEKTFGEFLNLVEELRTYRRFDSSNKRHAFYRLAPESWLEAILRKNIRLLDANLILSPLYQQFRAERDKIDLLALRRDGRLVVIELKVAPDRAAVFQAADYWRKIELQRRSGNLQRAKIFGEAAKIADAPALVYLVAPALSFHREQSFLARAITPEIEIYRFDLNENWRENLKVLSREKLAADLRG
ncbi:MAG: hypothetical protein M3384_08880 [Acidobacteriota bacterium]|nr:hypothetical protein [Acidobacteriota bacterium]